MVMGWVAVMALAGSGNRGDTASSRGGSDSVAGLRILLVMIVFRMGFALTCIHEIHIRTYSTFINVC